MSRRTRWLISYLVAAYSDALIFLVYGYISRGVLPAGSPDIILIVLWPVAFPFLAIYGLASFEYGVTAAIPYLVMMTTFLFVMFAVSFTLRRLASCGTDRQPE